MKFLVVGLGSMGKRRIRNLLKLKIPVSNIFGFDTREDRCIEANEKYGIDTIDDYKKAIQLVDTLIISTPPDKHLEYQKSAVSNSKHSFCEAGLFKDGLEEVLKEAKSKKVKVIASKS